jgi:hypothetical protein
VVADINCSTAVDWQPRDFRPPFSAFIYTHKFLISAHRHSPIKGKNKPALTGTLGQAVGHVGAANYLTPQKQSHLDLDNLNDDDANHSTNKLNAVPFPLLSFKHKQK